MGTLQSAEDWEMLYRLVGKIFESDRRTCTQMQYVIAEQAIRCMDYEQGKAYLQKMMGRGELPLLAADYFQENLMRTPEQVNETTALAENLIRNLHQYGDSKIGALVGIDFLTEDQLRRGPSAEEVLDAALESHKDDAKLRVVLARYWYKLYEAILGDFKKGKTLEEIQADGFGNWYLRAFVPFERFVDQFYSSITQFDIDILLHKLLLSPNGVLRSYGRKEVISNLLKSAIDDSDPELKKLLIQIVEAGLDRVDPVRIYQPIADVLRNRMFIRPQERGSNKAAIRSVKESYSIKNAQHTLDIRQQRRFVDALFALQRAETEQQTRYRQPIVSNRLLRRTQGHLRNLVPIPNRDIKTEKAPPLDYVLNVAKNMGAVGVRFLQLLGQYIDIPEEYRTQFDSVYDAVRGQLKWTAYKTLEREAKSDRATPELKAFWENLTDLSPTIGGGSLMTVYTATLKDGQRHVVKILNPNAEEFIRQNIDDANNILDWMGVKKHRFAKFLLSDLKNWLVEDINSRHKSTTIDEFAELHPNKSIQTGKGQVQVAVPRQVPTGTKYVLIEEFIEGRNLGELIAQNGANAAKYGEAIQKSYAEQLNTFAPDGKTRIHPDVHIGNVRIGNNGTMYWIDRGHYIECSQEDMNAIRPFLEGNVTLDHCRQAIRYLLTLPENRRFSSRMGRLKFHMKAAQNLLVIARQYRSNPKEFGDQVLIALRKAGLQIPIRFSLLFKNARAIEKIAERAGK